MNSSANEAASEQNQTEQLTPLFTPQQIQWIEDIELPPRLFLKNATEFDDQFLSLAPSDWRYRFSGENKTILFASGKNFRALSSSSIKLLKHLTVEYIKENSASSANWFAQGLARIFAELESVSRESLIAKLLELVAKVDRNSLDNSHFYHTLYALRTLERGKFFKSTGDKGDLEDLLLEVPRPRNPNWGRYQNLDLVIPDEVSLMIENGVQRWASKLCPKLETKEAKIKHLDKVKRAIKINALRDCIIIGIVYYLGARPVQIGDMARGDYVVDTMNLYGMRYSLLVPYAKKSKLTIDRVRIAVPEELGKLITLYKYLEQIGEEAPLFPTKLASKVRVDKSIKNMLLKFSPKEIQEAVVNAGYELPVYPASLFRHNVGHSMAMNGASAAEIAYILGHSNYTVANKYIAATPEMADIREMALGRNPVFKNMIALALTGNLVHSTEWNGRRVAASIGGKLHHHIGGCNYEENICPFSQGRGCYGCLYFMPFTNGKHKEVLNSLFDEIDEVRHIADDTGQVHHPLMTELVRRKDHVIQVMARIEMINSKNEIK
ncbi:site-specific integrase [Photobacterium damselae subsp. piscicida]|nr:site-specific integrase [Photobacterium damselae subsp. piscicida]PSV71148.1 site-specific integrase [Photobacterium damselae]PSW77277.1 site-specific integrase [Photobacterium damselae]QOD55025.1 site-specific integrase [Photobacterium damselae subsp. piscicida]QOD58790.1 site-specific integrase [Photobacterium damselae subsp. piscicida]